MSTTLEAETQPITDADALRQGDIFEWMTTHQDPPWRRWGLVVTADCDIVQRKHGNVLSYVPLIRTSDYTRLFMLPPLLEKALSVRHQQMMSAVHALQARYRPEFPDPLSAEAIETLLYGDGPDIVLDTLEVPPGEQRDRAYQALADVADAVHAQRDGNMNAVFNAIVRLRGGTPQNKDALRTQIEDKFARLPGDAFFIGRIQGADDSGFVAYLRLVRELSIPAIALKTPDLQRDGVSARRLSRLAAPFLYRLTQQLGDVFSSIGLPQAYENARREHVSSMWSAATNTFGTI
ncbi:MAG: hypothetical protein ABMB14_18665 [Myxococcota bacterium]